MDHEKHSAIVRQLSPKRIIIPIIIGLAIVIWVVVKDVNIEVFREISFTWKSVFWLCVAFMLIVFRTFFYMLRIRILTNNDLTWRKAFNVIMLWEFSSAITPSTVGGTALAVIFLHKEGINTGRSTAVTLVTSFLDELYFVIMLPVLIFVLGGKAIFLTTLQSSNLNFLNNLVFVSIAGYTIILLWVIIIGYGLFLNPSVISRLIVGIFKLPILKRWKTSAEKAGTELIQSSIELKKETKAFWIKSLFTTFITWTARYFVVNAILLAFFSIGDHLLIFARQLVLWIMMIISPTPGGSGFAEIILGKYIADLVPADPVHVGGVALAMALIWRILSYYPFLVAGALIVPGWVQRKFISK